MPVGADKLWLDTIKAVGIAVPEKGIESEKKRKKSSYEKAKKIAQEELRNIVMGLTLADKQLVRDIVLKDKRLEKKLEKVIKKSEVIEINWTKENGCIVRVQTRKSRLKKKMGLIFK